MTASKQQNFSSQWLPWLLWPFGAVFVLVGLFSAKDLISSVWIYRQAQSYEPVQAQLLASELVTRRASKGGALYEVTARYSYSYRGQNFVSDRVGLGLGADNISDWHNQLAQRLRTARERQQSVIAWVNPRSPSQAVLDRSLRWERQVFMIPFALVFPLGGLLIWLMAWSARSKPVDYSAADVVAPRPVTTRLDSPWFMWVFVVIWCGLTWPIFAITLTGDNGLFVRMIVGLFAMIGLVLAVFAWKMHRLAAMQAHVQFNCLPETLLVGGRVSMRWQFNGAWAVQDGQRVCVQLSSSALDRSRSGYGATTLWMQDQHARVSGNAVQVDFDIPVDVLPTGDDKASGEDVSWHVALIPHDENRPPLSWPVVVLPALQASLEAISPANANQPQYARQRERARQHEAITLNRLDAPEVGAAEEVPQSAVRIKKDEHGLELDFVRRWPLGLGVMCAALAMLLAWHSRQHWAVSTPGSTLWALWWWALAVALMAWALHLITLRWRVRLHGQQVHIDRGSPLRMRRQTLPRASLDELKLFRMATRHQAGYVRDLYSAFARPVLAASRASAARRGIQLFPSVLGKSAAVALVRQLWQAPTYSLSDGADVTKGVAAKFQVWMAWGLMALFLGWLGASVAVGHKKAPDLLTALQLRLAHLSPQGFANDDLFTAQVGNDIDLARRALASGADPNALSYQGRPIILYAASRGQMELLQALLKAGADPNIADLHSINERGDTALLVAAYSGHTEMMQFLHLAGAKLDAKNMWGWNAAHMAAQGDCVLCLQWLQQQGVAMNDKAVPSRGETPLMLAAGRGKLEAMIWLVDNGADLRERDPHGHDARGWALFFKRDARITDWIDARLARGR